MAKQICGSDNCDRLGGNVGDSPGLVSIVLPTYNGARYIRQSIDSCLRQTHASLELIVVNDGSTDPTEQIVSSYKDRRMRYVRKERNEGLPEALNTGFAKAKGSYLTWTSDDNYYAPQAIETMLSFLKEHSEVDFVYAGMYFVDEQGRIIREYVPTPPEGLWRRNRILGCFLYKQCVYEAVGEYNPAYRLMEDYDYWLRVAEQFRMAPINAPLYYYRLHADRLSAKRSLRVKRRVSLAVRHAASRRWGVTRRLVLVLWDSWVPYAAPMAKSALLNGCHRVLRMLHPHDG